MLILKLLQGNYKDREGVVYFVQFMLCGTFDV